MPWSQITSRQMKIEFKPNGSESMKNQKKTQNHRNLNQ